MVILSYTSTTNLSIYYLRMLRHKFTQYAHICALAAKITKMLSSPAPALPVLKHGGSDNIDEQGVRRTPNA